jgi:predicted  nucleic acid-binding Zn-ribbon protein
MSRRHQILLETTATRDRAEALLRTLLECKAQSERHLAEIKQADTFKSVTGRSALDNAIASTQRMIESLNRVISHARRELSEEDLAFLEELARGGGAAESPRQESGGAR